MFIILNLILVIFISIIFGVTEGGRIHEDVLEYLNRHLKTSAPGNFPVILNLNFTFIIVYTVFIPSSIDYSSVWYARAVQSHTVSKKCENT
jgi:hypothetical protein